jgi:hypothetical protein
MMNVYTKSDKQLDDLLMSISVSEMSLRYDRTPEDLEKFAIKLQRLAIDMKRIVVQAEMERIAMQPKAEKAA